MCLKLSNFIPPGVLAPCEIDFRSRFLCLAKSGTKLKAIPKYREKAEISRKACFCKTSVFAFGKKLCFRLSSTPPQIGVSTVQPIASCHRAQANRVLLGAWPQSTLGDQSQGCVELRRSKSKVSGGVRREAGRLWSGPHKAFFT